MSEANKELVRRFYTAQGKGDLAALKEIVTADFVDYHWPPGMGPGPESAARWATEILGSVFSEMEIKHNFMVAEGDMVDCHFALLAKHTGEFAGIAPKGNAINLPTISTFRIAGGKLAEAWELFDSGELLRQMQA